MHSAIRRLLAAAVLISSVSLISGCATQGPTEEHDPLEGFNRAMYSFNDTIDKAILKPVAQGYDAVLPAPASKGVSNFFSNIDDVVVIFNDLLQLKFAQAASDTARVVFNSTLGLFGLIDVASGMDLPKHNEDFGQTLGYWGLGDGPYLVLPFFGPSSARDTVGLVGDIYIDPVFDINQHAERNATLILRTIDTRAGLLSASKVLKEAALDPYIFVRDAYLQRRQSLVEDKIR